MIKQIVFLPWILLFAASITYAAQPGETAPSCSVERFNTNSSLNITDLKNKVVYVDFWASWCPPCKMSFPSLNQLHNELKDKGFEVVAINLDEEKDQAAEFLQNNPVGFSVGYDGEGKCPETYQVIAMPSSYIIDKKGIIREVHLGFDEDSPDKIRSAVLSLLSE